MVGNTVATRIAESLGSVTRMVHSDRVGVVGDKETLAGFSGIRALGPIVFDGSGGRVQLSGEKLTTLAAVLIANRGRRVSADHLIACCWPEGPPSSAPSSLRNLVTRLRARLGTGGMFQIEASNAAGSTQYSLVGPAENCDFEVLLSASGDPTLDIDHGTRCLELWHGEPFAGVDADDVQVMRVRLEQARGLLVSRLCEAQLERGHPQEAIALAYPEWNDRPDDERYCGVLMRACYALGQQNRALEVFERTRRHLLSEFGLDPTPETVALHHAVLTHELAEQSQGGGDRRIEADRRTGSVRLFGREGEIDQVKRHLDPASTPVPRVLVVTGEAGIGKTSLVDAVVAREAGHVVKASCAVGDVDAFDVLRTMSQADLPAIARPAAHEMELLLSPSSDRVDRDSTEFRRRLNNAMAELGRSLSQSEQPVMVVLDDMHWLRPDAIAPIAAFVDALGSRSHRCVVLTRHLEPRSPLATSLGDQQFQTLRVEPVGAAAAYAILQQHTDTTLSDELVDDVLRRTAGNPMALHLFGPSLNGEEGAPTALDQGEGSPRRGGSLLDAQLSLVGPRLQRWLEAAAVLGSSIDVDEVNALAGWNLEDEDRHLAQAAGILHRRSEGLGFVHELVRDALVDSVDRRSLERFHLDAAEHLTKNQAAPARIAHHVFEAGDRVSPERKIRAALAAGRDLERRSSLELARSWLDKAVTLADQASTAAEIDDPQLRGEGHLGLGTVLLRQGQRQLAGEHLLISIDLFAASGNQTKSAALALEIASMGASIHSRDVAPELLSRTLALGGLSEQDEVAVRLELLAAQAGQRRGAADELAELRRRATDEADDEIAARLARAAINIATLDPDPNVRLDQAVAGVRVAERTRVRAGRAAWIAGMGNWASALASLGRTAESTAILSALRTRVTRADAPAAEWFTMVAFADLAQQEGRFDEALEAYGEALRFGRDHGLSDAFASWATHSGVTAWLQRPVDDLAPLARSFLDEDATRSPIAHSFLALAEHDAGDTEAVFTNVDAVTEIIATGPPTSMDGLALTMVGHVISALADQERASRILELLEPYRGQLPRLASFGTTFGPSDRVWGRLCAVAGETELAVSAIAEALELSRRANAQPWMAWCIHDLHGVGGLPDRDEAGLIAADLGMRPFTSTG